MFRFHFKCAATLKANNLRAFTFLFSLMNTFTSEGNSKTAKQTCQTRKFTPATCACFYSKSISYYTKQYKKTWWPYMHGALCLYIQRVFLKSHLRFVLILIFFNCSHYILINSYGEAYSQLIHSDLNFKILHYIYWKYVFAFPCPDICKCLSTLINHHSKLTGSYSFHINMVIHR